MGVRENIRNTITNTENGTGCVVPLVLVILISAGVLRFVDLVQPTIQTPLLTGASGMIEVSSVDEATYRTHTNVATPEQTFSATLEAIGVYPEINSVYPKNTVSLVYAKDGWRFVQIDYKPNITFKEQLALYTDYTTTPVTLSKETEAALIRLQSGNNCVRPNKEAIGVCRISKVLTFPLGKLVVLIGADGQHATDGELIEIAKSMLPPIVDEQLDE